MISSPDRSAAQLPALRPPSFPSVATLALELDVSERTIHEMVRRGVLPQPLRFSAGTVRWCWADVEQALRSLSSSALAEEDPFMKGVRNAASPAPR